MRLVNIAEVTVGMKLAEPVFDNYGRLLLADGIEITSEYLAQFRAMGQPALYIADADTADIVPPQPVRPESKQAALQNLTAAFKTVSATVEKLRASIPLVAHQHLKSGPLAESLRSLKDDDSLHRMFKDVSTLIDDVMERDVLLGLNSIKTHDAYTFRHSIDVTIMALVIARKAGWDKGRLRAFGIGCMLHDLGKVFVDPVILNKPGNLTDQEYERVKSHPTLGYEVIKTVAPGLGYLAPHVAYQHHERQDGRGYPRGLMGDNKLGVNAPKMIHDFGAVSAVADVYDALSSDRPYRPGLAADRVCRIIAEGAGPHLNRVAVEIFKSAVPPYPVPSEIRVLTGRYAGYRGVVAAVDRRAMHRPKVRLLFNAKGERVNAVEIDLKVEQDVTIECVPRTPGGQPPRNAKAA